jgi:hypothetical protein
MSNVKSEGSRCGLIDTNELNRVSVESVFNLVYRTSKHLDSSICTESSTCTGTCLTRYGQTVSPCTIVMTLSLNRTALFDMWYRIKNYLTRRTRCLSTPPFSVLYLEMILENSLLICMAHALHHSDAGIA